MKTIVRLPCLLLIIGLLFIGGGYTKSRPAKTITVELQRSVVDPWTKNSTKQANDFCFSPKNSRPKKPIIFKTPMPANCTEARVARISEECVFKNLAYSVKMYYGPNQKDSTTIKQKDKSDLFVRLAIDLTSPWSWIKSPVCQTCDRSGKNCVPDKCNYTSSKTTYEKSFPCDGCEIIPKCGEIDSYAEGMTVVGQFVSAHDLRFKGTSTPIGTLKVLWAHALSGQHFLLADGVLGLGIEENLNSIALQARKGSPQKNEDTFREDDSNNDDLDDESDEETNDDDDERRFLSNSSNKENKDQGQSKYDFFEPEMNLVSHVKNSNNGINQKIFSLYIADDDTLKYKMIIGEPQEDYIYKPKENKILYIDSMVSNEMIDTYGVWVINVAAIRIARMNQEQRKQLNQGQKESQSQYNSQNVTDFLQPIKQIKIGNHKSILSLSTTALVLPGKELNSILEVFKNEYGLDCSISKEYLFFVVCDNIKSQKDVLADMTMIIEVGYQSPVYLQVNPADLILNCKKTSSSKDATSKCQMNLQQSYDDKIILGEAVLRNQYLVFDQEKNRIGFAPAKNTFNNASYVKKIEHLFKKIEEVIEEDIAYIVSFLLIMVLSSLAFLYFRHGPTLIAIIQGKRVVVLDDKNDRIALATSANETMDESVINELQQMHKQMEDPQLDTSREEENQKESHQIDLADF